MAQLDGKVAVVTGGANGIGRACCERFAEAGARVVVADVLDEAGAEAVAAVEAVGGKAIYVHTDVTSAAAAEAVVAKAVEVFGEVDILVTAAGISYSGYRSGDRDADRQRVVRDLNASPAERFVSMGVDEWQQVLDVNLTGTLVCMQAAIRRMRQQGRGGSVVTIASIAAKDPEAGPASYAVSKAGVWMLTKSVARSVGPDGIRVNAVGPGYIDTNMTAIFGEIPGARELVLAHIPLGRMGTARDVANTVLFLASDEASYFTGKILQPDGGWYTD
jgi:3-oxoacyl-[acyl-carrier protein] reductase